MQLGRTGPMSSGARGWSAKGAPTGLRCSLQMVRSKSRSRRSLSPLTPLTPRDGPSTAAPADPVAAPAAAAPEGPDAALSVLKVGLVRPLHPHPSLCELVRFLATHWQEFCCEETTLPEALGAAGKLAAPGQLVAALVSYLPDMAHFGPESTRAVELLGALLSKAVLLPAHVAEFLDLEAVSNISEDLPKAVDVISLIIVKVPRIQRFICV